MTQPKVSVLKTSGLCAECAIRHDPILPHDVNSEVYRARFEDMHGRPPTWDDAMGHCTEEVKVKWKESVFRAMRVADFLGIPFPTENLPT
jgi:hypothetical protein